MSIVFNSMDNNWVAVREYNEACVGRDTLFVERVVGVPESDPSVPLIHPNPTDQILFIPFENRSPSGSSIRVFDSLGQQVLEVPLSFENGRYTLSTGSMPSGSYVLEITEGMERTALPFVVQHAGQ
jgi:hypothetical protein